MNDKIDLSNVINVTLTTELKGLSNINTSALALFTTETPVASGFGNYRIYKNGIGVIKDMGSSSKTAAMAESVFSQSPNILTGGGHLIVIPYGQNSEKLEDAITRASGIVPFFGIVCTEELESSGDTAIAAIAARVQTLDKLFFYCSDKNADVESGGAFENVKIAEQTHTRCLLYPSDAFTNDQLKMTAAYASRGLSMNMAGENTALTMHLKTLVGILPNANETILSKAKTAGVDMYVDFGGVARTFTSGKNKYFDEIYTQLAFKVFLQIAGFNFLAGTNTKIAGTETGVTSFKGAYRAVCNQFVSNGTFASGKWTSSTIFGDPEDHKRNIADFGYWVYSMPISSRSKADAAERKAPLVQIACKNSGALHSSDVTVFVEE